MNNYSALLYHRQNILQTLFLLAGMLLLLSIIGWLIAGTIGVIWALGTGALLVITAPRLSPRLILYFYGALIVPPRQSPQLTEIITWLAKQSHLPKLPQLYYIPSSAMLAFSVGTQNDSAIAVSDGLLRQLNIREMSAVLAHEISHIQSKDLWVMAIADIISRLTSLMALTAYLMLVVYIPLFIFQGQTIPWLLLIVLLTAPIMSALMQLALSRTREFNADMLAIQLTGDPTGLISALNKIDHYEKSLLKKLLLPNIRVASPSLLRTHPLTTERIKRLQTIAQHNHSPFIHPQEINQFHNNKTQRTPKYHIGGLWH